VGFEDNVWFEKGVLAQSNAQLVERVAELSRAAGREAATPDEVRELFELK
jgi:3-keto-5-aminohexanoate cleavage enzyme